jgi:predicted phage tail protein
MEIFSLRRKIIFHGALGKLISAPVEVFAATIAEALKAVSTLCPELAPDPRRGRWRVSVRGCRSVEDIFSARPDMEEVHIFPAFVGGKKGGIGQIIIGTLLIVAAVVLAFVPGGQLLSSLLFKAGALVLLGGVLQLMNQPKRDGTNNTKNHYLSTSKNTVAIGTRIPILYGQRKIGGHWLAFNINAEAATS